MALAAVLIGAAVGSLAACSFSKVAPNATVHVSGRVVGPGGEPVRHVRVILVREADLGQVLFGSILALGTLSAICFAPDPPAVCDRARTTTTDGTGRYSFTLTGAETQGSLGLEDTLDVVVGSDGGASTTVRFAAKSTRVRVPDAQVVWPNDRVTQSTHRPETVQVEIGPNPFIHGSNKTYSVRVFDHQTLIWDQPLHDRKGTLDTRVLEDFPSTLSFDVEAHLQGGQGTGDVRVSYLSSPVPVRPTSGPPPSRGKPCAAVTGTRPRVVRPSSACALTDGVVDAPGRLGGGGKVVTGAVIDLGVLRPVHLVVARGFAGQVVLELSTDGVHFRAVASAYVSGEPIALTPRDAQRARFVRLRSPSGLDESLGDELAVW
ncbi:MAG: LigA protein [Marmoricola sp.]|nr:LigA protein [Marmoricola sp.]